MFSVLLLCGIGFPLPEEVTLIASGIAVGLKEANFWITSLVCVAGILAGDSVIFALGRYYGRRFLTSRPMQWILTERRLSKIHDLFSKHGSKAVFFTRFFAGVRIGVYAYAGHHGMKWLRFLFLDFLGALISGPTSIWVGKFVAQTIADPEDRAEARNRALDLIHRGQHWIFLGLGLLVVFMICHWLWIRRGEPAKLPTEGGSASGVSPPLNGDHGPRPGKREEIELMGIRDSRSTSGQEARSGGELRSRG
jgi:membrane protein DedA with SNARE-associated domain